MSRSDVSPKTKYKVVEINGEVVGVNELERALKFVQEETATAREIIDKHDPYGTAIRDNAMLTAMLCEAFAAGVVQSTLLDRDAANVGADDICTANDDRWS